MHRQSDNIFSIPGQDKLDGATENDTPVVGNLIDVDTVSAEESVAATPTPTTILVPTSDSELDIQKAPPNDQIQDESNRTGTQQCEAIAQLSLVEEETTCKKCKDSQAQLNCSRSEKMELEQKLEAVNTRLDLNQKELEREVLKRVDLEQRFSEEAKRTTDQIEELIAKSDSDDAKLKELNKKFDLCSRETSLMIENFTTNREVLSSQLLELRKENDYLLGKYIEKARDLQNEQINLPQNVDELQFHCLKLNETLILTTLAKERLEETMMQDSNRQQTAPIQYNPT